MDAAAYTYVFNHVVLPPKLPQSNDFDAAHEATLLQCFRASLNRFRTLFKDVDSHGVLTAASEMLSCSMKVIDADGHISATMLSDVLQALSTSGEILALLCSVLVS